MYTLVSHMSHLLTTSRKETEWSSLRAALMICELDVYKYNAVVPHVKIITITVITMQQNYWLQIKLIKTVGYIESRWVLQCLCPAFLVAPLDHHFTWASKTYIKTYLTSEEVPFLYRQKNEVPNMLALYTCPVLLQDVLRGHKEF